MVGACARVPAPRAHISHVLTGSERATCSLRAVGGGGDLGAGRGEGERIAAGIVREEAEDEQGWLQSMNKQGLGAEGRRGSGVRRETWGLGRQRVSAFSSQMIDKGRDLPVTA